MASGDGRAPWRVLVVDDEENLNWSLITSLRKDGYIADSALTGEEALRRLESSTYDCVVSDVKMPGMDGFELLQWLREHHPQTRVIMMTAFGSPTARQDALRAGVIAYLEKPFDLRELKDELRRLASADEEGSAPGGEGYDLLEVARVLNLARRDIALLVQSGGYTGKLRFARGELVWAEAGPLQGDAAFVALCAPRAGHAQPEAWDGRSERNVTEPVSRLIYQALALREGRPVGVSGALTLSPSAAAPTDATDTNSDSPAMPATAAPASEPAVDAVTTPSSTPETTASDDLSAAPTEQMATPMLQAARPVPPPTVPLTGPLAPPSLTTQPAPQRLADAVDAIARALGTPSGVALLRPDGTMLAQSWHGMQEMLAGTYTHLAASVQAASRALLLADLGGLEEARIHTSEHVLLLRRVARGERAAILVAMVQGTTDLAAASGALRSYAADLESALH